jgi:hypothetical protein
MRQHKIHVKLRFSDRSDINTGSQKQIEQLMILGTGSSNNDTLYDEELTLEGEDDRFLYYSLKLKILNDDIRYNVIYDKQQGRILLQNRTYEPKTEISYHR